MPPHSVLPLTFMVTPDATEGYTQSEHAGGKGVFVCGFCKLWILVLTSSYNTVTQTVCLHLLHACPLKCQLGNKATRGNWCLLKGAVFCGLCGSLGLGEVYLRRTQKIPSSVWGPEVFTWQLPSVMRFPLKLFWSGSVRFVACMHSLVSTLRLDLRRPHAHSQNSLFMYVSLFSGTLPNKSQILDLFDLHFLSSDEVGFPSLLSPSRWEKMLYSFHLLSCPGASSPLLTCFPLCRNSCFLYLI